MPSPIGKPESLDPRHHWSLQILQSHPSLQHKRPYPVNGRADIALCARCRAARAVRERLRAEALETREANPTAEDLVD